MDSPPPASPRETEQLFRVIGLRASGTGIIYISHHRKRSSSRRPHSVSRDSEMAEAQTKEPPERVVS